ncbi:MAG: vitamin B12-dependent ribonucleotide reductase [Patescibacteria group bacterium]|nr:vitamin B12-dependent ribonucleotide reductase [Patescibacteria group bacterium]
MEQKKIKISDAAREVLERRYLVKDENGKIIEKPEDLFRRVADNVAEAEKEYPEGPGVQKAAKQFYEIMTNLDFLPNSPTLMNAGMPLGQLSACFVLPVEDHMESIFESVKNTALIHKSGGGTGFSFSRLRPSGDIVKKTQGVSSGPLSFMTAFDAATETVKQGGKRRGANMGILRVDHPDIMKFIVAKEENDKLNNFNISVAVTEDFMKAVESEADYDLINPKDGSKWGTANAKEVFDKIVSQAWKNGEPGIIFIDRMNKFNPTPAVGEIESTNPCGEQPLLPYESCNLGSINLANFVRDDEIDYDRLEKVTRTAVRFLDDVIDVNKYPIPEIGEMSRANRKIGLGVMGFADMLALLSIRYDSDEGVKTGEAVMKFIEETGHEMSRELARERGTFPNWKKSIYGKKNDKIRNATVTTIAPTGTISMIADASSGVEPLFAVSFIKNVMDKDELVMTTPVFLKVARERGFYSEELMKKIAAQGDLVGIDEVPDDIKEAFVVAHQVTPEWHLRMQAAFQKYTDNAVSKTVNFPNSATKDDVREVYKLAYELGCKGVTIYRDGSRDEQVLNIGKVNKKGDGSIVSEAECKPVMRKRPKMMVGRTMQIMTGCGKLYVTINEDEDGQPFELFSTMGKAGGCAASQAEAISRMVSVQLRSGVEPMVIVKHLKNITCHRPYGFGDERVTSCSDAIGKALEQYMDLTLNIESPKLPEMEVATLPLDEVPSKAEEQENIHGAREGHIGGVCPECGGPIEYEGGCLVCRSCAYSECA